jgi:hypothetical protein
LGKREVENVGLVDLVDQDHRRRFTFKRLPEDALDDVTADVGDLRLAKLRVTQARDGIVFVETLLRLGRRLDMPLEQRQSERGGDFLGQHGLPGPRLTLISSGRCRVIAALTARVRSRVAT